MILNFGSGEVNGHICCLKLNIGVKSALTLPLKTILWNCKVWINLQIEAMITRSDELMQTFFQV